VLQRPEADAERVAVIGHSQGALAAAELAFADDRIGALVLLAMSGRPVEEALKDQIRVQGRWVGQSEEQIRHQIEELSEFIDVVRREEEWSPEKIPPRFYVAKRQRKWYADHLNRDARQALARLECPVLLCQGAKDFQVSLDLDARPL